MAQSIWQNLRLFTNPGICERFNFLIVASFFQYQIPFDISADILHKLVSHQSGFMRKSALSLLLHACKSTKASNTFLEQCIAMENIPITFDLYRNRLVHLRNLVTHAHEWNEAEYLILLRLLLAQYQENFSLIHKDTLSNTEKMVLEETSHNQKVKPFTNTWVYR